MLIGPPASGKSLVIEEAQTFWTNTAKLFLAPSAITRAGLIDCLEESRKTCMTKEGLMVYHPLLIASSEFGNLVPAYENDWINQFIQLYDCLPVFRVRTRELGEKFLEGPYINLIAGTTPQYLKILLPEAAYGMGFFSRFIMVYAAASEKTPIFSAPSKNAKLRELLSKDLLEIVSLQGDFEIEPEAENFFEAAYKKDFPPIPEHPKLLHYNGRRLVHVLKVAMVISAAKRSDLRIRVEDMKLALIYLHEAEQEMPQIFKEMSTHGFADVNQELWQYAQELWFKTKQPIPETKLVYFLNGKVPNVHIMPTLVTMVKAGMMKVEQKKIGNGTLNVYVPTDPRDLMR